MNPGLDGSLPWCEGGGSALQWSVLTLSGTHDVPHFLYSMFCHWWHCSRDGVILSLNYNHMYDFYQSPYTTACFRLALPHWIFLKFQMLHILLWPCFSDISCVCLPVLIIIIWMHPVLAGAIQCVSCQNGTKPQYIHLSRSVHILRHYRYCCCRQTVRRILNICIQLP